MTLVPLPVLKPRVPPLLPVYQFTPSARAADRATSRNRTFSMTCCGDAMVGAIQSDAA